MLLGVAGEPDVAELREAWLCIQESAAEITGLNSNYIKYLRHKQRYIILLSESGKHPWKKTLAQVENARAESIKKTFRDADGNTITADLLKLSKYQGYRLDPEKTTVREFYTLIKIYSNGSDQE